MNILIIEDEKLSLRTFKHCIELMGHNYYLAENGMEAINMIRQHKIDFIFSDILMPGISGLSLVSVLRNTYLMKIPIVMVSSLNSKYLEEAVEKTGANDFIRKPFTVKAIAEKIQKFAFKNN